MNKSKTKTQKFIRKALNKQFQLVGFKKFDPAFVDDHPADWYKKFEWDEKTEKYYFDWFIQTAAKDLKISKKSATNEANWWILNYGWKTKHV